MATDPLLSRVLAAAGLRDTGSFAATPGWVNRVWVSDALVVRLSDGQLCGSFLHEAQVVGLLAGTGGALGRRTSRRCLARRDSMY